PESRVGGGSLRRNDRGRAQREEPDHRAHLEARRRAVWQPQDVVVEPVRLVPHFVVVIADPVHGVGDSDEVLKERERVLLVLLVVVGQDEGDLQHDLAVEGHPGGAIGLLEGPPVGSGAPRSNTTIVPKPRNPPAKTLRPSGSLRFTHQLKLSIKLWNEHSRNLRSSRPRPRSTL